MKKSYKLTIRLYRHDLSEPKEQVVVTDEPFLYVERLKADLAMNSSDVQVGSYNVEPINHLKVVK